MSSCPKIEKCPIFLGESFEGHIMTANLQDLYKKSYCLAGKEKYSTCKRYMVAEALGIPIPKMIMPNSSRTIEEIRIMIENQNKGSK